MSLGIKETYRAILLDVKIILVRVKKVYKSISRRGTNKSKEIANKIQPKFKKICKRGKFILILLESKYQRQKHPR